VFNFEFHVTDGSNQIETQSKTFAAISVALTQNAKDFQPANDVFNQNTFSCQGSIAGVLFRAQRMKFTLLGRRLTVWMKFS
jgi:hypothetical protein